MEPEVWIEKMDVKLNLFKVDTNGMETYSNQMECEYWLYQTQL